MHNNTPPIPPAGPQRPPQRDSQQEEKPPHSSSGSSSNPSADSSSQIPSMASRIQDSASGLLYNTFSGPSSRSVADDIASTLAAGLTFSGKGSLSSSPHAPLQASSSTSGNILQSHGLSLMQPSIRAGGDRMFPSESFRSTPSSTSHVHNEDNKAWEQFQDSTQKNAANNDTLLLNAYDLSSAKGKGKRKSQEETDLIRTTSSITPDQPGNFDSAWHNPYTPNTAHNHNNNHIYTPKPTDGQAVVSLLSSPSFQSTAFTPPESPQSELFELDTSMLPHSSSTISPTPLSKPPFTSAATTSIPTFLPSQLSLIPDIASILSAIQQQDCDWTQLPSVAEWLEVDQTYQDTVWGFLKPYVEAVRKEMGEKGEIMDDGPAVKRLGLVLGHLSARL
ncbi:hypothetical protein PAAG_04848 [Paracoccidioides lutzii Pb01]|uniref:Uncharacterized protein n=1 Tax=Paracoccidioides lutzii (strain ATCC MYA-826 / Pb01) TaxID=502779 RepID=C1H1R2_PARBA|nr:hypothetical protein PAAG_04848 [Paracoccidioides lutzii Pb01]EEH33799.1 hypothetical protein PAAG_04848 [Paracoccidioides lutzii Pb01]